MGSYRVTTPVVGFSGQVGNVHFAEGAATVDDETHGAELSYFRAQGYGVEEAEESAAKPAPVKKAAKPAVKAAVKKATAAATSEAADAAATSEEKPE